MFRGKMFPQICSRQARAPHLDTGSAQPRINQIIQPPPSLCLSPAAWLCVCPCVVLADRTAEMIHSGSQTHPSRPPVRACASVTQFSSGVNRSEADEQSPAGNEKIYGMRAGRWWCSYWSVLARLVTHFTGMSQHNTTHYRCGIWILWANDFHLFSEHMGGSSRET